jgi:hypothetical protein
VKRVRLSWEEFEEFQDVQINPRADWQLPSAVITVERYGHMSHLASPLNVNESTYKGNFHGLVRS